LPLDGGIKSQNLRAVEALKGTTFAQSETIISLLSWLWARFIVPYNYGRGFIYFFGSLCTQKNKYT